MYIDPVVVVEGSVANANNPYVVGVRNIDAMGFEVSLQTCNYSTGIPFRNRLIIPLLTEINCLSQKALMLKSDRNFHGANAQH